jgi:uncharacterized membrane protein YgaE (UPF0421/DUF939 family)
VYELAPYRILVMFIGVVLAFIFTMFPFPVTSRYILRQDTAHLFHLLSSLFHLTQARMRLVITTDSAKESQVIRKQLLKTAFKCIAIQQRCKENLTYTSWEPNLHHRFPVNIYAELLNAMQRYRQRNALTKPL